MPVRKKSGTIAISLSRFALVFDQVTCTQSCSVDLCISQSVSFQNHSLTSCWLKLSHVLDRWCTVDAGMGSGRFSNKGSHGWKKPLHCVFILP